MNSVYLPKNIISGYFDCSVFGDLKESPKRTRTLFEIEYFLEDGRITYSDNVAYPVKKGYVRIGSPNEVSYSLLPFKTKYVKFSANGYLAEKLNSLPRYFRSHKPFEIEKMLDEIILLTNGDEKNELKLYGKLMIFIAMIIEDSETSLASGVTETVLDAKSYIETHVSEPIQLTDIAKAVNLSPNYLHTIFKNIMGATPRDYLTDQRLKLAGELLRTTSLPISNIAEKCGFCNQQYMSTLFKKKFTLSPIAYRKENAKEYLV